MKRTNNIDRMRDARLIANALQDAGPQRAEFVLRLRRSFHQWGSLTEAKRATLQPTLIAVSSR